MALTYDFDMFSIMPEDLQDKFGGMFDNVGATGVMGEQLAMFRDPQTVAALERADQAVRTYFLESGFGMQVYSSGAPPGRYLEKDGDARIAVIEKLTANLATHDLDGADWGGFEFPKFMESLAIAEPLDDETLLAPTPHNQQAAEPRPAAPRPARGRRLIAFLGLVLGLILLLYVASQMLL